MQQKTLPVTEIFGANAQYQLIADTLHMHGTELTVLAVSPEAITIAFESEAVADAVIEKIKQEVVQDVVNRPEKVLFRSAAGEPVTGEAVWNELLENDEVIDYGDGHIAFSGIFLRLFNRLNEVLTECHRAFQPREIQFPNLISVKNITRLGIAEEFPHYLTFNTALKNDYHTIADYQANAHQLPAFNQYLEQPQYCLKTSACSLVYPYIQNRNFTQYTYFATLGFCTRNEKTATTCERLREFHQKELVFLGDKAGVKQFRNNIVHLFSVILDLFGMEGRICTANDSFFLTRFKQYQVMQLLNESKFEMRIVLPGSGREVSAGSFNNHDNYFSKRFNFSFHDKPAKTACKGIGLERLVYAILYYHGRHKETWLNERINEIPQQFLKGFIHEPFPG